MVRKLAFAFVASLAFAAPAFAAQRGLPDRPGCTYCLPSLVTGGPVAPVRGRLVAPARAEAAVTTARRQPVARKLAQPPVTDASANAVANAACVCARVG